ncbi:MAG: 16S rRNA (guanine(527)-N(7))-methyltransferase RsmG [Saprospiraceae bacterium]|nr:16S rRNA (guanine(527)-N(7))-methyltransferase RsmG [Saprospiraceae bacterium]MCF8251487.1 16S rRNA (guanine(527)-N(7))-methyltransferase RsmG [Saprospiraceae bacterium]MCF8280737.1 16S rRNA (guanine(527)-N(7))-methyltransferase RsmG [Bacteroidales bacterium]MCF8313347.1 16S rRNA (guanine(527)-N(7))-methyltransferase RsmG [Saprospiraceae bacterium]MCF8441833.1 16S rRNA (guanine(527)-N(7))-methyltransferase RsmG [Saprospiraceae bacterium]
MQIIEKYFPDLTDEQRKHFASLEGLYRDWNSKVNLVSRKDIDHLYEHHVLHSLAIAKVLRFNAGAEILDVGTGGGFPGIPLAILMPEVRFHLIDGTLKKIKVVQDVIEQLSLENAKAQQIRAEELKGVQFDFVVTRAVAELNMLRLWTSQRLFKTKESHSMPNGLIALKGGNVKAEIKALPKGEYTETFPIPDFFEEDYFKEKFVVYLQA